MSSADKYFSFVHAHQRQTIFAQYAISSKAQNTVEKSQRYGMELNA